VERKVSHQFATAKNAKDFLVEKVAAQASIENIPLSEAERKLMYYSVDDPSSQTSEENCSDDPEFETKVSDLIARAYKNDSEKGRFKAAFKKLSEGDHYLSVMNPFTNRYGVESSQAEWYPNPFYWAGGRFPLVPALKSTPLGKSGPLFLAAIAVAGAMILFGWVWISEKESFWHWFYGVQRK
jgi:hypothetical protein